MSITFFTLVLIIFGAFIAVWIFSHLPPFIRFLFDLIVILAVVYFVFRFLGII